MTIHQAADLMQTAADEIDLLQGKVQLLGSILDFIAEAMTSSDPVGPGHLDRAAGVLLHALCQEMPASPSRRGGLTQ